MSFLVLKCTNILVYIYFSFSFLSVTSCCLLMWLILFTLLLLLLLLLHVYLFFWLKEVLRLNLPRVLWVLNATSFAFLNECWSVCRARRQKAKMTTATMISVLRNLVGRRFASCGRAGPERRRGKTVSTGSFLMGQKEEE